MKNYFQGTFVLKKNKDKIVTVSVKDFPCGLLVIEKCKTETGYGKLKTTTATFSYEAAMVLYSILSDWLKEKEK